MIQTVIRGLALGTLVFDILIVLFVLSFTFAKNFNRKFTKLLKGREVLISFAVSLIATFGSLFLSEIAKYTPCEFCWFQRIFMYPLTIILGVAYFSRARDVERYVLPLTLVGGLISIYHNYLQRAANPFVPCSAVGFSVSCTEKFFTYYGYITIPFMALTAFVTIFLLMLLKGNK